MKKLLLILVLLLSGFTALPGNLPVRMEISSTYFSVDTSGIVPDKEGAITQFAPGVFLAHNYLSGKYFTVNTVASEEVFAPLVARASTRFHPDISTGIGKYVLSPAIKAVDPFNGA